MRKRGVPLNTALCYSLLAGRQVVRLRKRGSREPPPGFAIEHDAFLLCPNTEHQRREQRQPRFHPPLERLVWILRPAYLARGGGRRAIVPESARLVPGQRNPRHTSGALRPTGQRARPRQGSRVLPRGLDVVETTHPARLRALEPHTCRPQAQFDIGTESAATRAAAAGPR